MKIRLFIYIIFFKILLCQTSSLAMYGFGEYIDSYDASSVALGDINLFTSSKQGLVLASPSSFSKIDYSNLSMTVGFNNLDSKGFDNFSSNNFSLFSFIFPINKNISFDLGMNPVLRSDLFVEQKNYSYIGANESDFDYNNDGLNDPLAYKTNYDILGCISEFNISLSNQFNENFAFGLKIGRLFGTNSKDYVVNYFVPIFNDDGSIGTYIFQNSLTVYRQDLFEYSSLSYQFDIRTSFEGHDFVFLYNFSDPINVKLNSSYNSIGSAEEVDFYSNSGSKKYSLGYKNNITDNFGFIFELNNIEAFNNIDYLNIFNDDGPDINSIHAGFFYKYYNKKNKWNNIDYRFGFYSKKYEFNLVDIYDKGLTFGLGFEYLDINSFSIALKYGFRDSEFHEFRDERYLNLYLSTNTGENWFLNQGRK